MLPTLHVQINSAVKHINKKLPSAENDKRRELFVIKQSTMSMDSGLSLAGGKIVLSVSLCVDAEQRGDS